MLTVRELSRMTPDSLGAKLSIASTALRAYRNRHLGTLMCCCEAWKPLENCFDPISFECVDFQRLSQIIANLTLENLVEREAEITNLPWTRTEKVNAPARCRVGQRHRTLAQVPKRSAQYVYHTGTLVSSAARAGISCPKKEGRISNSSITRWTFFQFLSTSSRKDDLMDIDMVKNRETRNTIRLTN